VLKYWLGKTAKIVKNHQFDILVFCLMSQAKTPLSFGSEYLFQVEREREEPRTMGLSGPLRKSNVSTRSTRLF
jgi:hypothetical protein